MEFLFPALFEANNVRRTESTGIRTENGRQGLGEISGRDSLEVKNWDQRVDAGNATQKGRQYFAPELPRAAPIANARSFQRDWPDPRVNLTLRQISIPHDHPLAHRVNDV